MRALDLFGATPPARRTMGSHQSSRMDSDTWLTPPEILAALGPFDLDPCTPAQMPWPTAARRYTPAEDGLIQPWRGYVWLNPPYGSEAWRWLARLADHGNGVALVFARTETEGFHREVWAKASALLFLSGRLHFHHPDGRRARSNAGAPSVLVAYGNYAADRLQRCGLDGAVVWLRNTAEPSNDF